MRFKQAIRSVYSKPFTFTGRAPFSEYWWVVALFPCLLAVLYVASLLIPNALQDNEMFNRYVDIAAYIFLVLNFFPILAAMVRRLHDSDHSGWWSLILLSPLLRDLPVRGYAFDVFFYFGDFLVSLFFLYLLLHSGTDGPNRFGSDPLSNSDCVPLPGAAIMAVRDAKRRGLMSSVQAVLERANDRKTLLYTFLALIAAAVIFVVYWSTTAKPHWPVYHSAQKSISFDYPPAWTIEETDSYIYAKSQKILPQWADFRIELALTSQGAPEDAVFQNMGPKAEFLSWLTSAGRQYKLIKFEHHGCAAAKLSVPFDVYHQSPVIYEGHIVYMLSRDVTVINCANKSITVTSEVNADNQKESMVLFQDPLDRMLESISFDH